MIYSFCIIIHLLPLINFSSYLFNLYVIRILLNRNSLYKLTISVRNILTFSTVSLSFFLNIVQTTKYLPNLLFMLRKNNIIDSIPSEVIDAYMTRQSLGHGFHLFFSNLFTTYVILLLASNVLSSSFCIG